MEEEQFDFTDAEAVKDFIATLSDKQKSIEKYAEEYSGSDDGRKIRKLQVGQRKDYTQGKTNVTAERLKVQYQKKIVNTAVSFLFGDAPDINASDIDNEQGKLIKEVLKKNRINAKLQDFAESVMSTTIGVFIFSKDEDKEIKIRFYNHENGKYYPKYDVYGDLIGFGWEFEIPGEEGKHVWFFTPDAIHKHFDDVYVESEAHDFGVIPVVFVDQKEPEWWEVKEMIDRLEMLLSKLSASNNYFAFPILKLKGGMVKDDQGNDVSLIDVDDDGKTVLLGHAEKNGQVIEADAEFLQRDTGVESIQLEKELLQEFIHSISQTPDLSFDNVKGIGAISGRALMLMLQDAINKAKRKKGAYQTAIERMISIVQNGLNIQSEDLTFDVEFNLSIPTDEKEVIDMLFAATGGKASMAQETAVQNNPLVKNPAEEMDKIQAEGVSSMGETYTL